MMARVVTFGEIMLRLSPPGYLRFEQAGSFDAVYGGGEANVAVSLSHFGLDSVFVSRIPDNPIGQAALNGLRRYGVDVTRVARGGERLGIYFYEKGASQRPSKVVYDRAHSAIAEATPADFDWKAILSGAAWLHVTGIAPALSDACADAAMTACATARALGCTVSCDLNFRKNLWSPAKASNVMTPLMKYVDICIANEEDSEKVFGIHAGGSNVAQGTLDDEGYRQVAAELVRRFGFKAAAITLRGSITASDNTWGAMIHDANGSHFSRRYPIHIVDRVGGGDAFAAGLIYGILSGMDRTEVLEFAVAASCLKHTIEGDTNHVTVAEVKALMAGGGSGRVQR